jgi:hypothetical protein
MDPNAAPQSRIDLSTIASSRFSSAALMARDLSLSPGGSTASANV